MKSDLRHRLDCQLRIALASSSSHANSQWVPASKRMRAALDQYYANRNLYWLKWFLEQKKKSREG